MTTGVEGDERRVTRGVRTAARLAARLHAAGFAKVVGLVARRVARAMYSTREFRTYGRVLERTDGPPELGRMSVNSEADLLAYLPATPGDRSIQEFLQVARQRLADGQVVFTYAEGGLLLHYSWLTLPTVRMGSEFGHEIPLPDRPVVLWDDYTHPAARGRGLHTESLRARLSFAAHRATSSRAAIGVRADNGPSRHNIEKVGFTYVGSAWLSTRLGRSRRWLTYA